MNICAQADTALMPLEALTKNKPNTEQTEVMFYCVMMQNKTDTLIHLLHQEKLKVENIRFVYTKLGASFADFGVTQKF